MQQLENAAHDGHRLGGFTTYSPTFPRKESPVRFAPVVERTVALSLDGSVLGGDLVVRHHRHVNSSGDERRFVEMINNDLDVAPARNRLAVRLACPQETGACTLSALSNQCQQCFGQRRRVAVSVRAHASRRNHNTQGGKLCQQSFNGRKWFHGGAVQ